MRFLMVLKMDKRRPTVFIGSSVEGLGYANAIFQELERETEPTVWDQNVFEPTRATLEQLESLSHSFDYAVLVMTPDDLRTSRDQESRIPRDNVIAELGLFIGALGRSRVFFVKPRSGGIALPTDLLGITPLEYADNRSDNIRAAVRGACIQIKSQIERSAPRVSPDGSSGDVKFWHTVSDREAHGKDVRALVNTANRRIIITGISLTYPVRYCARELQKALSRNVHVAIIISDASSELFRYYARYSQTAHETIAATHTMYAGFANSLNAAQRNYFSLYCTDIPLTHSIGLYDDGAYFSEFCIDHPSSVCPSFCPPRGSPTFSLMLAELKELISKSRQVYGPDTATLIGILEGEG